jgi:WD40 repeat protein
VIRIWDPRTGSLRDTVTVPGEDGPLGLAFAPDGSLAASFPDGRVLVFDPAQRPRRTLTIPPELYPAGVAFSPDGSLLTVLTNHRDPDGQGTLVIQERDDPDVAVWDARTLQPRAALKLPGHESITQAFTPDGRYLLVGSNRSRPRGLQDAAVWRYRVPDLSLVDRRDMPGSPVSELAVSPDSTRVALAHGRSAPVLRVDALTPAGTIGEHPVLLSRVAWSPDGRTLATATDDVEDVTRLWDTPTGEQLAEVRGDSNQKGEIAFSPDGSTLVAGANDWTVTQWHLHPDDAVRRVCDMLVPASRHGGRNLPDECR